MTLRRSALQLCSGSSDEGRGCMMAEEMAPLGSDKAAEVLRRGRPWQAAVLNN